MSTATPANTETKVCEKHGTYSREWAPILGRFVGSCPACDADRRGEMLERVRQAEIADARVSAEIPERYLCKGFEDYAAGTVLQRAARQACQDYVQQLSLNLEAGVCLVLLGPPGVGKSHLLCSMIDAAAERLRPALYCTMADFLAAIRGNWAWHADEHAGKFTRPDLLALDEVWTPAHERDREAVVALIDERYRACKATILASNLTWTQMRTALGERVCDRLLENGGRILPVDGESFRSKRIG